MTQHLKSYLGYSYPAQLADLVKRIWPKDRLAQLPLDHHLRQLFDIAYHASMLRDEDRQVTFRLLFGDPGILPPEAGPPDGLMPLVLERRRPFEVQEIRRLAMAALFFRSMIGVCPSVGQDLQIWGVIVSGTRWLSSLAGGRYHGPIVPDSLVIHSLGPGNLTVNLGRNRIAALSGGQIESKALDLFESKWLRKLSSRFRHNFLSRTFGESTSANSVPIDVDFIRMLTYNILLRTLAVVRGSRHGGTLLALYPAEDESLKSHENLIRFKYLIADCPARHRYEKLMVGAMMRLSEIAAEQGRSQLGWNEYQTLSDSQLSDLDEALFDFAHFLADLMSVDGALVITNGLELLGFGAELRASAPQLKQVRHGLDLEGEIFINESLDNVGTRHRAVYRFCDVYTDCLAIVVSQDGTVQFVKKHNGEVTYWNQLSW
jgi:hypothetical protein